MVASVLPVINPSSISTAGTVLFLITTSTGLSKLYLFYTVMAGDDNLQVDAKDTTVTIAGNNSYKTERSAMSGFYMPNYYYSDYLEDVYVGSELKIMETVWVPKGELTQGRQIVLSGTEGEEDITLMTDDILFCDSPEKIAQIADMEGYEQVLHAIEPADADTTARAKSLLNGYYFSFFTNNASYQLEFFADHDFEIRMPSYNLTNTGTYTVRNGYIVLYYPSNQNEVFIPYEFKNGDISLDCVAAFDVNEM